MTLFLAFAGKVDKAALLQFLSKQTPRKSVKEVVQDMLHATDTSMPTSSSLLQLGFDSFDIVNFIRRIELECDVTLPTDSYEVAVTSPLCDFIDYLKSIEQNGPPPKRRKLSLQLSEETKDSTFSFKNHSSTSTAVNRNCKIETKENEGQSYFSIARTRIIRSSMPGRKIMSLACTISGQPSSMSVAFKYDLKKCIDASPLLCSFEFVFQNISQS